MVRALFKKIGTCSANAIAFLLISLIWLIRPLLGPMNICPYTIGCTQYAIMQIKEQPLLVAIKNIMQRIIQCHPFGNRKI